MKKAKTQSNARKGHKNGEAIQPLTHTPTVHAAGTNDSTTIVEPKELQATIVSQLHTAYKAGACREAVAMTVNMNRAAHRAATLTALRLGMLLIEHTSEHSRLYGCFGSAADARCAVHQIRLALALASQKQN